MLQKLRSFQIWPGYFWLIAVVILATALRFWQLEDKTIFFGDAGRDLQVAYQAITTKELPLLGIPSSVPRFHQGPVSIWLSMAVLSLFGHSLYAVTVLFSLLSVLAVIAVYELVTLTVSRRTAVVAATLLAVSPLSVAHGRMPYHITPIPLVLVLYLASLAWWYKGGKWGSALAIFSFCLLFQFELALLPLAILIPYVWRKLGRTTPKKKEILLAGAVGLVGLWPQVLYDLTHRFAHLGGFAVWVVYRIVKAGVSAPDHAQTIANAGFSAFATYGQRMVSVEFSLWTLLAVLALLSCSWSVWRAFRSKQLPFLVEISAVGSLLLLIAFAIHGSPSEAYFPPFLVLLAILLSWWVSQNQRWLQANIKEVAVGGWVVVTAISIAQANFFVSTTQTFNYGPGSGEQTAIVRWLRQKGYESVRLRTTNAGGVFPSYFDTYKWLGVDHQLTIDEQATAQIFIESKNSSLSTYPDMAKASFTSVDVYAIKTN